MCAIVASTEKMPTRLAMKFGVSFARITPLPSVVTRNVSSASSSAGSVAVLRDQLDQMHVARRIEEMDAAEARAQRRRQRLGQRVDRQPRRVRRDDRVRREMRRRSSRRDRASSPCARRSPRSRGRSRRAARDRGRSSRHRSYAARSAVASGAGSSFARPSIALLTMPFGSPSFAARSNSTTGTPALTRWAAICAPITPAPRTAALRTGTERWA